MSESRYAQIVEDRRRTLGAYCLQDFRELAQLAGHIERLRPGRVLEIGVCEGGWLYVMAPFFAPGATLVGIDPLTKSIIREERLSATLAKLAADHTVHLIWANSESAEAFGQVREVLDGQKLDLLHIDGAHDYESVLADWQNYGAFVRPGGLVVFHDISSRHGAEEVHRVWDRIVAEGRFRTTEISVREKDVGIGVVEIDDG